MANVKISQLTPKGANLAATDLLEISEFNGSGYETKSITGQEIIDAASGGGAEWGTITGTLSSQTDLNTALSGKQATLVSGTNIKTINGSSVLGSGDLTISGATYPSKLANSFSGIEITGQTVAISDSLFIPANTITATNFVLQINASLYRTFSGSGGGVLGWLYLNTTNSLTGATLIGRSGQIGSGQQWSGFIRNFPVRTTTAYGLGTSNQFGQDFTSNSGFTFTFNKAQNNYLIFAVSSVNVSDGGTWVNSKADLYV